MNKKRTTKQPRAQLRANVTRKSKPLQNKKIESFPISLSKFIAISGVCSRRKAVEIINQQLVTVNGVTITEPAYKLAESDRVKVDGALIKPEDKMYILLNKPKDCITTLTDEKGRKTVMDLINIPEKARLYPIGRLDRATTGALLLTNDGDLAQQLSHPKYEVSKVYHATLDRVLTSTDVQHIKKGVMLEDGMLTIDDMEFFADEPKSEVLVELHSGKNHVVRRLFEALGYKVRKLDRIMYAGLSLQGLKRAQWRYLTKAEVKTLKQDIA